MARKDPGFGPPPGSSSDSKTAPHFSMGQEQTKVDQLMGIGVGGVKPDGTDPGFQPPRDPVNFPGTKARAPLVFRDIPLVTLQNSWSVDAARSALAAHNMGIFEQSAQLCDSILGDDRVTATLGSRATGLFGREVVFKPANDSTAAREVCDAWAEGWDGFANTASMRVMNDYAILMGFSMSQLVWDTGGDIWRPYLRPWNARYSYYHWQIRKYIALSQDGQIPIVPGDGKWFMHAPFGEYRGWIRGAIRAVTEPWMLRHFAFRDMARFSEVHGLPTRVGKVPAVADPEERAYYEQQLINIGSDAAMILPQGVDGQDGSGYAYELVEAKDTAWEVFPGLIDRCDMAIVLALLFQNLTTEVKGGSFAATSAHMDIRQSGIQGDNTSWKNDLMQVARPFAFFNYGDADLAPITCWDVADRTEFQANADQFQKFGMAIEVLARAGIKFEDVAELQKFAFERMGLEGIPKFTIKEPAPPPAAPPPGGGGFGK